MAKKYIDAEQLKQTVETSMDMQDLYLPSHFIDVINGIPAADVAPVRRGRWIENEFGAYCSGCGLYAYRSNGIPWKSNYCPICGARMEVA